MEPELANVVKAVDKLSRIKEHFSLIYRCYQSLTMEKLQELHGKDLKDIKIEVWNCCKTWITQEETSVLESFLDVLILNKNRSIEHVISKFDEESIPDYKDKLRWMVFFIEHKDQAIKGMFTSYSFLETKYLDAYLSKLVENCDVKYTDFIPKYQCQCGIFTDVSNRFGDVRENYNCCNRCGRSTKTWKLVSGKTCTLIIRKSRKWFGIKTSEHIIGFEPSKYKMYDPEYEKYLDFFSKIKPTILKE
jgi:hypothetical protein